MGQNTRSRPGFERKTHVSLPDAERLEDVGGLADLLEELLVAELDVLSGLISLPDDGSLEIAKELVSDGTSRVERAQNSPCWGACKPTGPRSCTRRSSLPRGTTGRPRPRTSQP